MREILSAEQQEALGVPVSRVLSVVETGEPLHQGRDPAFLSHLGDTDGFQFVER